MHSIMHPMTCFPALKLRSEELWACIRYLSGSGTGELPVHVGCMKLVKQGRKEWAARRPAARRDEKS
jgi:hypothetical protein